MKMLLKTAIIDSKAKISSSVETPSPVFSYPEESSVLTNVPWPSHLGLQEDLALPLNCLFTHRNFEGCVAILFMTALLRLLESVGAFKLCFF